MIHRILVPLDGTAFGEYALSHAVALAQRAHAAIALVHVRPGFEAEPDPHWLERRAHALRITGNVAVLARTIQGTIAEALCEEIAGLKTDLVVMATHARSGLSRARLGSVGDVLVRQAAAPVLLLQPPSEAASPPRSAGFRRILVVLDGSAFGRQVLPHARELSRVTGAALSFVRTSITGEIIAAATTRGADIIAIATHGRGGLSRLLLGSMADELVRSTSTPVLLFRPGPSALRRVLVPADLETMGVGVGLDVGGGSAVPQAGTALNR